MHRPPFCPNAACSCHISPTAPESRALAHRRWFKRNGTYPTRVHGEVVRFKCLVCSSVSVRAAARILGCSCDSVTNRTSRLARQCISAHAQLLEHLYGRFEAGSHRPLVLNTDRKLEYARALAAHRTLCAARRRGEFRHRRTDSRARREHPTPLKGIVRGALRRIRRQASRGEVDLEAIREELGVEHLVREQDQYLPRYALA